MQNKEYEILYPEADYDAERDDMDAENVKLRIRARMMMMMTMMIPSEEKKCDNH